jgi:hypothetical protein
MQIQEIKGPERNVEIVAMADSYPIMIYTTITYGAVHLVTATFVQPTLCFEKSVKLLFL